MSSGPGRCRRRAAKSRAAPPSRRSAAFAAFSTSASSAVAAPKVTARPARALKRPVRVSAGHQHTPAYRPLKRCAYSMANEVLPTPPMPCTAARPTDACVTAAGLSCIRMASSRSSSSARPVKLAIRGGTPMNGRGGGGAACDWRSAAAMMRRLRSCALDAHEVLKGYVGQQTSQRHVLAAQDDDVPLLRALRHLRHEASELLAGVGRRFVVSGVRG